MPRFKLYSFHDAKKTIQGIKLSIKGKINSKDRTNTKIIQEGIIPNQTFSKNVSYAIAHAPARTGSFGIKV
jgi:ribosomal protein S3